MFLVYLAMLKEFEKHITETFAGLPDKKLLLAVSGGIDSMVMLYLCNELNLNFAVAHCNFNLRDTESDGDEAFVRDITERYGRHIYVQRFATKEYAAENGLNTQLAARELRYHWFNTLCNTFGFDHIVVAHHANDKLETFLINLSRGTGIEGLTGIPEVNGRVIRPLLPFSRAQITDCAAAHHIAWREDSSNESDKYLRNKIRHHLTPLLEALHPNFLDNFLQTQSLLQGTSAIAEKHFKELKSLLFIKEEDVIKIPVAQLKALQPVDACMYGLFKEYKFTAWADVINLLYAMSGKVVYSATHELSKDREFLILRPIGEHTFQEYVYRKVANEIHEPLHLKFESVTEIQEKNVSTIYVDKEKLNLPLIVRKWNNGDYFHPFGMFGKKKVSKFFKDEKFSLIDKEAQWILCSGTEIAWIIGKRADSRFAVNEQTTSILKIQLLS